ncbi:sulfatase [Maribacter algarum]|uniref:Sulfatase n=1 Tax=Maribacter algarum (ex Zhang et al. 2020) TaxID=2578118 RepID=A0A5S3QL61_9FLAO|nr:sulfatase [Maribacter algarum]TMM58594.1 sulfatase [Maribacter algarum]
MCLRLYIVLVFFIVFSFARAQEIDNRPNILVIMFDDAGLDMSAYGSTYVNTPGFDAIAKDGVLFNRAYTPNAKCAPSRASVITGRNSWQLDAAANHVIYFPSKFKTYQEALLENGYTTGHTGKGYGPALTFAADGSERQVMGPAFNEKTLTPPTIGIGSNDYSANFKDFLDKAPADQPWSFWIGTIEPHRGYEYGSGAKLAGKTTDMIKEFPLYWPDNEITRNDLLDYAYEIEDTDKHIQKVLKTLEERNLLENTLIVVTSDHGMPFPRVKGNQYENANHVPMAMLWKGKSKGKVVDDYISFIDLAPTFLEAAGVDWASSGMHPATGKSLMNIITSEKSGQIETERDYVLVGKERHDTGRPNDVGYPIRGIYKDSLLYLKNYEIDRWPSGNPETGYLNTDGSPTKTEILNLRRKGTNKHFWKLNFGKRVSEELYDIKNDPYCINNLANNSSLEPLKAQLKSEMEAKLLEQNDLRMKGFGHLYEAHPFTRNNDFYGRFMSGEETSSGWVNDSDFEANYIDGEGNTLEKVEVGAKVIKKD